MNCSFCGKSEDEVRMMMTERPGLDLAICDECITLCHEVVSENYRDNYWAEYRKEIERIAFLEIWGTDL